MKRTDMERRDRDLKKAKKKEDAQLRKTTKGEFTVGEYTDQLVKLFFHDEEKIFNIQRSAEIMELVEEMSLSLDNEKELDNALRKAVRMTKVKAKKQAFDELKALLS